MPNTQPRSRRSCTKCKLIKSKCEAPDDLSAACWRCARLGIPCEFSEKPRGVRDDGSFGIKRHAPCESDPGVSTGPPPARNKASGAGQSHGYLTLDAIRNLPPQPSQHVSTTLPVSIHDLRTMHRAAVMANDTVAMSHVVLLAGASGECFFYVLFALVCSA